MNNIEQTILITVLECELLQIDKQIIAVKLIPAYFKNDFNKKVCIGIERSKELGLPISMDVLRQQYQKANKWSFIEDNLLLEMATRNPIGSYELFIKYYELLEKEALDGLDRKFSI